MARQWDLCCPPAGSITICTAARLYHSCCPGSPVLSVPGTTRASTAAPGARYLYRKWISQQPPSLGCFFPKQSLRGWRPAWGRLETLGILMPRAGNSSPLGSALEKWDSQKTLPPSSPYQFSSPYQNVSSTRKGTTVVWMCVSTQNPNVDILVPQDGSIWRWGLWMHLDQSCWWSPQEGGLVPL